MLLIKRIALAAGLMLASSPAFAAEGGSDLTGAWRYLAAGLAIGLAVIGGASGQGRAAEAAYTSVGRNPQAADKLFTPLLLGLALIEFQTILAFIIAILLVLG